MTSPPNAPDPRPPGPAPTGLPPAPWIPLEGTTAERAAAVLDRLEQWLAGAERAATTDCARTHSHGQADAVEVPAWVGTRTAHPHHRIEEVDSWS